MDVLTYSDEKWPYSDELKSLGINVFSCNNHRNPISLLKSIRAINDTHGPYNAIHGHEMFQNGLVLAIAWLLGIKVRISHAHNSDQAVKPIFPRRAYNFLMRWFIFVFGTNLLSVSDAAGKKLYGDKIWARSKRAEIAHCGLDFSSYRSHLHIRGAVRDSIGIPHDAIVMAHVGRFVYQKNHEMLLRIASEVMKNLPNAWLICVGEGDSRSRIENMADELGIKERCKFLGARNDVPQIILDCCDIFVLPSRFEGLGLVIVEAMAAGKPSLVSDVVPNEADVIPDLIFRMPLDKSPKIWADKVMEILNSSQSFIGIDCLSVIEASQHAISHSYEKMRGVYGCAPNRGLG
ncbi:glycosyltransferase [[Pseudomonas] boreopolis]|uniref:glycosyltransferase n=1 Tax=Xanthomonas boreopolis TaxID=86183 RepID=UPI003D4F8DF0